MSITVLLPHLVMYMHYVTKFGDNFFVTSAGFGLVIRCKVTSCISVNLEQEILVQSMYNNVDTCQDLTSILRSANCYSLRINIRLFYKS